MNTTPADVARATAAGEAGDALVRANLRRLRRARGWTQDDLAHRVGLSQATVRSHETGARQLKAEYLHVYARVLGCRVWDLFEPDAIEPSLTRTAVGGAQ